MRFDASPRVSVRAAGLVVGLTALLALAACTSGAGSGAGNGQPAGNGGPSTGSTTSSTSAPSVAPTTPASTPAIITTSSVRTKQINPTTPFKVSIEHGTLTAVTMVNSAGTKVAGVMAANGSSWHNTEDLGYAKTYQITAVGKNAEGSSVTQKQTVTTIAPKNKTAVYLDRTGDYALTNGATYGVAILPEMYFDETIASPADKAAAEKAITVKTSPQVAGAWAWQDNNRMLWRPKSYWPAGTKVTINANIYGVKLGNNLYGQGDKSVSFTIGRQQITKAVDTAPKSVNKVRVYNAAGKVIRTMNTSMGEHRGITVNGLYINFYTMGGTYTVLEHDNPAYMSSDSYGLPASLPDGYAKEPIYWSTKISVDGIYLHELTTTTYAQDHGQDVSHGCLNLNTANATWYFQHSLVGDPVEIVAAKGAPRLKVWQGGAWGVPWSAWRTGDISNY